MSRQVPASHKLRQWRRGMGMTQAQAGAMLQVAKRTWLVWENGGGKPDEASMLRLYVATDGWITPNDFYPLPQLARMKRVA